MSDLSPEERLVLGLADESDADWEPPALISDGHSLRYGPPAAEYHPRLLAPVSHFADSTSSSSPIDPEEQFFWELNGYIVLRGVMDSQCAPYYDRLYTRILTQLSCAHIELRRDDA